MTGNNQIANQIEQNLEHQRMLRSKQAAFILNISEELLRKARSTGYLLGRKGPTYYKLGRSVRYKLEDLQLWIDSAKVEGAA